VNVHVRRSAQSSDSAKADDIDVFVGQRCGTSKPNAWVTRLELESSLTTTTTLPPEKVVEENEQKASIGIRG